LQQLREALPDDHPFRFLIHDRDSIFSPELDKAVAAMGVRVLRTPLRSPQANARCERMVGTIRRECLDFLIPLGQRHLKHLLNRWVLHYNHGRVHMTRTFGVFVSSTFEEERNVLQEKVFPILETFCLENGARFQTSSYGGGCAKKPVSTTSMVQRELGHGASGTKNGLRDFPQRARETLNVETR
jgi:hypothetical protein